jgi:hypothetical protein
VTGEPVEFRAGEREGRVMRFKLAPDFTREFVEHGWFEEALKLLIELQVLVVISHTLESRKIYRSVKQIHATHPSSRLGRDFGARTCLTGRAGE